jgi:hypothetical protein
LFNFYDAQISKIRATKLQNCNRTLPNSHLKNTLQRAFAIGISPIKGEKVGDGLNKSFSYF